MQFDYRSKLWECAGTDKSRPILTHVNLFIVETEDGRSGWLEATDSYIAVRIPITLDAEDTPGLLTVEMLKAAAKNEGSIICDDTTCTISTGQTWPRPKLDGKYPDLAELFKRNPIQDGVSGRFGFSPALFVKAEKALGSRGLKLSSANDLKPIRVESLSNGVPGAECLVMPIRL